MAEALGLVADIGATNARFAMVEADGSIGRARVFATDDYAQIADAIAYYLANDAPGERVRRAVLAVACPVVGDHVALTNHIWAFSSAELASRLELNILDVINDCAAIALAVPRLEPSDYLQIGRGKKISDAPIAIIAPGSGLGVGAAVLFKDEWVAIAGEG